MESQCKTHGLTPFREVWPTACRCCAAPCRRWRRYQYSIIRHASQGCRCLVGRVFCRRSPPKARCRGEQCSPVGVWSVRSHGQKVDAVQGWRANSVRPYMLYIIKQPVLYCAVFSTTRCHSRSCHSSYSFYYVCPAEERCSHINQFRALMNNMNDLNDLNTNFTLVTS